MKDKNKIFMKNIFNWIDVSLILIIGILTTSLCFISYPILNEKYKHSLFDVEDIDETICENKSLKDTSICLRDYVKTFYFYNLSNLFEDNFTKVKESGGVCSQYNKFYSDSLNNLNFNAKTIIINGEDLRHEIAITWTKNLSGGTYCIIDQKTVLCNDLAKLNMTRYGELIKT